MVRKRKAPSGPVMTWPRYRKPMLSYSPFSSAEIDHRSAKRVAASRHRNARKFKLTASSARLAQVVALRRSWLEKRPLGLADGRFIPIVTGRGRRKLLGQGSARTGQFPRRCKNAAVEQKSTAIGFQWSVHQHDQAVFEMN